jgi:hypothetical protein
LVLISTLCVNSLICFVRVVYQHCTLYILYSCHCLYRHLKHGVHRDDKMLQNGTLLGVLRVLNTCFFYYSLGNASSGFHIIWISEDECTRVRHIWITWVQTWQDHCFVLPKESLWDLMA